MRTLWRLAATVLIGGVGVALTIAVMIPGAATLVTSNEYSGDLDDALSPLDERSFVYAANGAVIGKLGRQDREAAKLSEVPAVLIDAIITVEDESFYTNPGIDLEATIRALAANIDSGRVVQGGSTITQQLVKNRIVGEAVDADRKLHEVILALRITANYSKNEVLEQYLNTVYFGENSYGVKAAAERMFITVDPTYGPVPKTLDQLTLADAALLAGVISNPEGNNPFTNPDGALRRRTLVLERMRDTDTITDEEFDAAVLSDMPSVRPKAELRPANDYVQEVQKLITHDDANTFGLGETLSDRENRLLGGGLRIYTPSGVLAQAQAESAVRTVVPDDPNGASAALVAMKPKNGHVVAMANLEDFSPDERELNVITDSSLSRQQGSTFKAITLAAAFENGYSPEDTIDGTDRCADIPDYADEDPPYGTNAGSGGGIMTLRAAAKGSVNCAFLRLQQAVGDQTVADMAVSLGLPRRSTVEGPGSDRVPDSLTLGTRGARPLDMATVFNTLAADGIRHDPVFITRIEERDGTVIFEDDGKGERVVSAETARTVADVLQAVFKSGGTGTRANIGRVAAGKTGTTDGPTDAWFAGWVPQLTAVAWMGHLHDSQPLGAVGEFRTVFGGTYPALIWKEFMQAALADEAEESFIAPNRSLWPNARKVTVEGRGARTNPPPPPSSSSTSSTSLPPPSSTTLPPPPPTIPPASTTTIPPTTTTVPAAP